MCNPIAIAVASFAVTAASAFVQYRAQAQAAAQQTAMHQENMANLKLVGRGLPTLTLLLRLTFTGTPSKIL